MGASCCCCPGKNGFGMRQGRSSSEPLLPSHVASPSPFQRMQSRIRAGSSALNRGFGGFRPETTSGVPMKSFCKWYWKSTMCLILGALITIPCSFALDFSMVLNVPVFETIRGETLEDFFNGNWNATFFKQDKWAQASALRRLVAIPLTCAAINFLIQHIRHTTFWWEAQEREKPGYATAIEWILKKQLAEKGYAATGKVVEYSSDREVKVQWSTDEASVETVRRDQVKIERKEPNKSRYDPISCWSMVLATLFLLQSACLQGLNEDFARHLAFDIRILITVLLLRGFYLLLDLMDVLVRTMVQEQEIINSAAPVKKMQELVRTITRSGRPEKDYVYCFASANTVPAEVMQYIWSVYYIIGKVGGAAIALGIFMGVDDKTISNWIFGGIALSAATASGFAFELGPNTLSLFRLALNKPFYVGDLVTLNSTGAMDTGGASIMGFVENITVMYVVIRNFEMKQTWIPHRNFSNLIIQNWTRRPTKTVLLFIGISSRCSVKKAKKLTEFGLQWIRASPEIQQTNYQKCHIVDCSNGYKIEIIFFPTVGVTHRGIRQKFLIAFMEAGERLKIPFVPLNIMQNFCDAQQHSYKVDDLERVDIEADQKAPFVPPDLDDLLPDPNDLLPKGVGLGFRQFPTAHPDIRAQPTCDETDDDSQRFKPQ